LKYLYFTRVYATLELNLMLDLENVYKNDLQSVKQEVAKFWKSEGALVEDLHIEERLSQVVFIIRNSESGNLVGVSTAEKKKVQALNNNYFYEFRCFIEDAHRIAGLDVKLSSMTFNFLESIRGQDPHKPIGIFSVLENDTLKKEPVWRRAVWPEIEMYFVGFTNSGNPIRVHYFKGVRI
jgi:hypothetical protein